MKRDKAKATSARYLATAIEGLERRILLSALDSLDDGALAAMDAEVVVWRGEEVLARRGRWLVSVEESALDRWTSPLLPRHLSLLADSGFQVDRDLGNGVFTVSADGADAFDRLSSLEGVIAVEPDTLFHVERVPNDPQFDELWGLHNTSQTGGTADADIDAPEAWDLTTGDASVVVAVIDTGVDYTHPDLAANIWINPGEIAGDGIDNDANGFIDDVRGWDFQADDNDPMDVYGHGTHVAGTIAAVGDNALGIAGVSWSSKVLAIKALDDLGYGWTSDFIAAINYAVMLRRDKGINVRVLNNSWGGGNYSDALKQAIEASRQQDMLFVAAAGNRGQNTDYRYFYPAGYDVANVLAVAASDAADQLATFSNRGAISVDLAAPGVDILSTLPHGHYMAFSGTSMAAPHVAGAAALLWSRYPSLSAATVRDLLMDGTDALPTLAGLCVSGGRLNAHTSLMLVESPSLLLQSTTIDDDAAGSTAGDSDGLIEPGERIGLAVRVRNGGLVEATGVQVTLLLDHPHVAVVAGQAGIGDIPGRASATSGQLLFQVDADAPSSFTFPVQLALTDSAGHTWSYTITLAVVRTVALHGLVTLDGQPLPGATVTYTGPLNGSVVTGLDGRFSSTVPDGAYTVIASKQDYLPGEESIVVQGSAIQVDFSFTTFTISGHLVEHETGAAVAGLPLRYSGPVSGEVLTDAAGDYVITRVVSRPVTLQVLPVVGLHYQYQAPSTVAVPPSASTINFTMIATGGYGLQEVTGFYEVSNTRLRLNNRGEIICTVALGSARKPGIWKDGQITILGASTTPDGFGGGINNLGEATGSLDGRAFIYRNGEIIDIHPAGMYSSGGRDINDLGQVVGSVATASYQGIHKGFLWQNGQMRYLEHPQLSYVDPMAINNLGQVVGTAGFESQKHGFLWENGIFTLLGPVTDVDDINDLGMINLDWKRIFKDGREIIPPVFPDTDAASIYAINNLGQMAGFAFNRYNNYGDLPSYSSLWADGVIYNLNAALLPETDIPKVKPIRMNDVGQILAEYTYREGAITRKRTVLLTPSPARHRLPVAMPQDTEVPGIPTSITLRGVNPDGTPFTYAIVDPPSHGTLSDADDGDAAVIYTPEPGYVGPDSFTFRTIEGTRPGAPATVSLNVHAISVPPVAADDAINIDEDQPVIVDVMANDSGMEGHNLYVFGLTLAEHGGLIHLDGGRFQYNPDLDFNGVDTFTYVLGNGLGGYDTATVTITIRPINDAPVTTAVAATLDSALASSITVTLPASDVDQDGVTYTIVQPPRYGTLSMGATPDQRIYTPHAATLGARDYFTFKVSDGRLDSNVSRVDLRVLNQRFDMTKLLAPAGGTRWSSNAVPAGFNDAGDVLITEVISGSPDRVWLVQQGQLINASPTQWSVFASGLSDFGHISMSIPSSITSVPELWLWKDGQHTRLDSRLGYSSDVDSRGRVVGHCESNDLSASKPALWEGGLRTILPGGVGRASAINELGAIIGNLYNYVPVIWENLSKRNLPMPPGYSNGEAIGINDLGQVAGSVKLGSTFCPALWDGTSVTVLPGYYWRDEKVVVAEGLNMLGQVVGRSSLTGSGGYSWFFHEDGITYNLADLVGMPDLYYGSKIRINDRAQILIQTSASEILVLTPRARPGNRVPAAAADCYSGNRNTTLVTGNVLLNDSDPDGDPLAVADFTQAQHGQVRSNRDGTFSYTPYPGYHGQDSFTCTISDGNGAFVTTTVNITVNYVPNPGGSISGRLFDDRDGNASRGTNEPGLGGWIVYSDFDNDAQIDDDEPSVTTAPDGTFEFTGLAAGSYRLRHIVKADYIDCAPGGTRTLQLAASQTIAGQDLAVFPTSFSGGDGADRFHVSRNSTGLITIQATVDGVTTAWSIAQSTLRSFSISTGAGDDQIVLDYSGALPCSLDAGAGTADALTLFGYTGEDRVSFRAGVLQHESNVMISGIERVALDLRGGNDQVSVEAPAPELTFLSGGVKLGSYNSGNAVLRGNMSLARLGLATHVLFTLADAQTMVATDELSLQDSSSKLDLGEGGLAVRSYSSAQAQSRYAQIQQAIRDGMIFSTMASGRPLVALLNRTPSGTALISGQWRGATVDNNSILIALARPGDCNLDHLVDADDYFHIDSGFLAQGSGWTGGDFNGDGRIDIDDYFLIDQAYALQSGLLAAQAAPAPLSVPVPMPPATVPDLFGDTPIGAEDDVLDLEVTPAGVF